MRILLLTHAFNSLSQRLFVELGEMGHEVSVEFDVSDTVSIEAVRIFKPQLIIAPFLKRMIPEAIWRHHCCLIVHPGIVGDRGPSALDWAILNRESEWGVTILQANGEADAGDIWASSDFRMRRGSKSSIYRNEVTEAAVRAVMKSVTRFERGGFRPEPQTKAGMNLRGKARPLMRQCHRRIDWQHDSSEVILRKINSSDGHPGVPDSINGRELFLYDAHPEERLHGDPGVILAKRQHAICRATVDGAVWIGQVRRPDADHAFKLPAAMVMAELLERVPEEAVHDGITYRDIWYEEFADVGYLHFPFYNGAMSSDQCKRLLEAYQTARRRNTRVIVLMGGPDFWSNGLHLNVIEAADSPADESWRNINAMNDLAQAIITTGTHVTMAALQGNAGAGGVFLALAADRVMARSGIVLNPHYKGMGNLYGSEYWSYLLPRRIGKDQAEMLTEAKLPMGCRQAKRLGLIDDHFGKDVPDFVDRMREMATALAGDPELPLLMEEKRRQRARDEAIKPLARYREEELRQMRRNFYGPDPSYHVARYDFVYRRPKSRTPPSIAIHRRSGYELA